MSVILFTGEGGLLPSMHYRSHGQGTGSALGSLHPGGSESRAGDLDPGGGGVHPG